MDDQDTAPPKQPSQRITPYLNKVTTQRPVSAVKQYPTPASTGKFKQRTQSGAVLTVLNEHIHMPDSAKVRVCTQRWLVMSQTACWRLLIFNLHAGRGCGAVL